MSRNRLMLSFPGYDSRQPEQMRADLQVRLLGHIHVDLKLDLVRNRDEVDHPAAPRKFTDITDRQRAASFQPIQNRRQATFHVGTDIQDMAELQLLWCLKPFNRYSTALRLLTINQLKCFDHRTA